MFSTNCVTNCILKKAFQIIIMFKRFLIISMPINGIFNKRQQVHKQRHLKTVNHLWDSGHVLSFMASARVQMTGMAKRVDDLVPCPLTVLLVGRPSNADSLALSWTCLAGSTTSPPSLQNTCSLSCWSSSSKYSSNKVLIAITSGRITTNPLYRMPFSTRYESQVCAVVELHSSHASMDII